MSRPTGKIVAVGGGENGRVGKDGEQLPYELAEIDEEIIRLSGRNPKNSIMRPSSGSMPTDSAARRAG